MTTNNYFCVVTLKVEEKLDYDEIVENIEN